MAKAYVNPDELRRFAMELKRFNNDLKAELSGIHHSFVKLGETWQDQEHAKFAEVFDQMVRALSKFADAADKHIPFLLRKAERIQEYLDQR
ncbi:MAG TPA: WXG100 family type VII secretion target [Planctomycetota bacterium]|nr:WXG100 family type VII secretion target [Planctomycetota bacterium]